MKNILILVCTDPVYGFFIKIYIRYGYSISRCIIRHLYASALTGDLETGKDARTALLAVAGACVFGNSICPKTDLRRETELLHLLVSSEHFQASIRLHRLGIAERCATEHLE